MACKVLEKVICEVKPFHPQLVTSCFPNIDSRDASYVSHLCFGVLRFYPRLLLWLKPLMRQPLKPNDKDIELLIILGLYQLFYTDTPAYAAMHATVEATKQLKKKWAQPLVNGVLRQAQRLGEKLKNNTLVGRTAHPEWLAKALQKAWPNDWENIIEANLQHPPFVLRVNLSKISRENYLELLGEKGIQASIVEHCDAGLLLNEGISVDLLPGFATGLVSVQDGAAQLAAKLLDLKSGQRVLDACAAPGGKSAHILETMPTLKCLVALEKDETRYKRLLGSLARSGLSARTHCADATTPSTWWDGERFDRILLDAPCSATGIIRRHPDIKLHRQPQDILLLVQQQKELLEKLWPLLKPDGILLYATCSVLPQENVERIAHFLQTHPDAKELPIKDGWGIEQRFGQQILPNQHMDGFYYARLHKQK